jgi:hypothetical protein
VAKRGSFRDGRSERDAGGAPARPTASTPGFPYAFTTLRTTMSRPKSGNIWTFYVGRAFVDPIGDEISVVLRFRSRSFELNHSAVGAALTRACRNSAGASSYSC